MHETITIRPKRPKAELLRAADGNLNRWFNNLIEQALGPREVDWHSHFDRRRSRGRKFGYEGADAVRKASR